MPKSSPSSSVTPRRVPPPNPGLEVSLAGDRLCIGPLTITFHCTLRIPDNDRTYPLPPSLGAFALRRVADHAGAVPESWLEHGGVFLPMFQREAMWMGFGSQRPHKPSALKVGVGKVCALSGRRWSERLHDGADGGRQDYMVVPGQPWLDGINSGNGTIRQFVAMALGLGYTVEGQLTGEETHGGVQLCVFEPKDGRFPDAPPPAPLHDRAPFVASAPPPCCAAPAASMGGRRPRAATARTALRLPARGAEMGLAAGGHMTQSIYPDPHGVDVWDQGEHARVYVHIVNSELWQAITGEPAPASPISASTYKQHGLPWFALYDEHRGDIKASKRLKKVKSVAAKDAEHGFDVQDDGHVVVAAADIIGLAAPQAGAGVTDGTW